jgi:hypothetical protein
MRGPRELAERATATGGAWASGLDRRPVTRRAALRALPQLLEQRFSPEAAGELRTLYELRVLAPSGAVEERFALRVADGRLRVERRAAPEAVAWVSVGLGDMIRVASGAVPLWGLMAEKRLDIGGEPFTALRFPALLGFELSTPRSRTSGSTRARRT